MKCGECKFWESKNFLSNDMQGICSRAYSSHGERSDDTSLAVAQDYESYGAMLETNVNFGCIQFVKIEVKHT